MTRFLFVDILANQVPLFAHLARAMRELGAEVQFAGIDDAKAHLLLRTLREPIQFGRNFGIRHPSPLSSEELEESIREHWEVNRTGVEDSYFHRYLLKHAERVSGLLDHLLEHQKVDAIVVWNGLTGAGRLAVELARRRALSIWFFENGFFPGTLQCDPQGINFQNSISSIPGEAFDSIEIDSPRFQTFLENLRANRPADFQYRSDMSERQAAKFRLTLLKLRRADYLEWLPQWRRHLRLRATIYPPPGNRPQVSGQLPLTEPYILVPLQVNNDTQIRVYSPNVPDMSTLIAAVYEAWRELDHPKIRLAVKEHPAELTRIDYTAIRRRYPDIYWIEAGPTQEWLSHAEVVVTINSTAGVEALALNRPVVTLGEAFYNKDGIIFHCKELTQLRSQLGEALRKPLPKERIEKFIYFLRFQYLIEGSWRNWSDDTIKTTAHRLLGAQIPFFAPQKPAAPPVG